MGVKLRRARGKWYLYIDWNGKRKCKCVGTDRRTAEEIRRQVEAKLALGDLKILGAPDQERTFQEYAERWLLEYSEMNCKPSTVRGYRNILNEYVFPDLGRLKLSKTQLTRDRLKSFLAEVAKGRGLSRNTMRNIHSCVRGVLTQAVEDGILESNPAARLGKYMKGEKSNFRAVALTRIEVQQFLDAALEVCPEYYPLFLTALRAGLRRGELVALQWGDIQFGANEDDPNRFILVQRNYVHRRFTTPKSKKSHRVDMSKQLRSVLLKLRDLRLLAAFAAGHDSIADDFVFPSPDGHVLDPDNLFHRYFLPVLAKAGLRRIRLHDLRHTFGSLLIQDGATLTYVKEQMGHSSIQVTVDIYGHLVPGANVSFVDRLDQVPNAQANRTQTPANRTQTPIFEEDAESPQLIDSNWWRRLDSNQRPTDYETVALTT